MTGLDPDYPLREWNSKDGLVHYARFIDYVSPARKIRTRCGLEFHRSSRAGLVECSRCQRKSREALLAGSEPDPAPSVPDADESPSETPVELPDSELSVIRLRPGDILVLRTEDELSEDDHKRIRSGIGDVLPQNNPVMVISGTTRLSILRPTGSRERRKHPKCPCGHSMGTHYPSVGCTRCACGVGKMVSPV